MKARPNSGTPTMPRNNADFGVSRLLSALGLITLLTSALIVGGPTGMTAGGGAAHDRKGSERQPRTAGAIPPGPLGRSAPADPWGNALPGRRPAGKVAAAAAGDSALDLQILSPPFNPIFRTTGGGVELSGVVNGSSLVTQVRWASNHGHVGVAEGTSSWRSGRIPLEPGINTITVTAADQYGDSATATVQVEHLRGEGEAGFSDDVRTSTYLGKSVTYDVVDGLAVFEGDIVLGTAEQLEPAVGGDEEGRDPNAGGIYQNRYLWPGGVVPYTIGSTIYSKADVNTAISYWNNFSGYTGITLVARTNQANYVNFNHSLTTCSSAVGMRGGQQDINYGGCGWGGVVHEIGHAIGLWHEQSRTDRDSYVTINWSNIQSGKEGNFNQYGTFGIDIGVYDYDSIMHYGMYDFSANSQPTIVPKSSGTTIGQRDHLSAKDLAGAKFLYQCLSSGAQVGENNDGGTDQQTFVAAYTRNGGKSPVGCPLNAVHSWYNGRIQDFNGGSGGKGALMKANGRADAFWIHGGIWNYYEIHGGPNDTFWDGSKLGYPISDELRGANSSASNSETSYSVLENGTINFYGTGARSGQAYVVRGAILTQWGRACSAQCYEAGPLGMPTGEEVAAPQSPFGTTGRYQDFETGQIYWHATGPRQNNTYYVQYGIASKYKSLGSGSALGFPTSNEYSWLGKARSDFEGGYIYWDGSQAVVVLNQQSYSVTVSASPSAGGTVTGGGTFAAGSSRTVTATANSGYAFVNWTESGTAVSTNASYNFTLSSNRNLVANFTQQATLLSPPVLVSPGTATAPGSSVATLTPTFSWQPVTGADGYALYVSRFNGSTYDLIFDSQVDVGHPLTGTSYVLPSGRLADGGQYRWNMSSHNSAGYGSPNTSRNYFYVSLPPQTYTITVSASPGAGGTVTGGGTFAAGSSRTVTATANSGYTFANWTESGSVVSSSASYNFTLNANRSLVANFTANTTNISVTVQTSPAGRSFTVDGGTYTAAQSFVWAAGSTHTIGTTSPQNGAAGTRYVWSGWSDGGAITHSVSPSANATYTASFNTQHFLTMNAGQGGGVSPVSNWYNAGQGVSISATPNAGFGFGGWTGSGTGAYTGPNNPATVVLNGPVTETAAFTASPTPTPTPTCAVDNVWAEDGVPTGATAYAGGDGWNWVSASPSPFSGSQSHQSALIAGYHDHYFLGAANPLPVAAGDVLFAYVYLDPLNPPSELMLSWNDGAWGYRAYWGANLIQAGADNTASRRYMGPLPAAGRWARLEVPAALVGLEGHILTGMSFIEYDGRATWNRFGKACAPRTTSLHDTVWVGDALPAGASAFGTGEGWGWVGTSPYPYSGGSAHQSANAAGYHDHYFINATDTLAVNAGDTLVAYVYLDPASPPSELMLSWNDGAWGYRAYWGANLVDAGTDGTASRRYMGPLPAAGQWVRLEVPAALVGLEGRTLRGVSFIQYNGRATWDHVGKSSEQVWVEDAIPGGATAYAGTDGWSWVGTNPVPYSGSAAHQTAVLAGAHDHYFINATSRLSVNAGDRLFAYVYLDPLNPPSELMLSWNDGAWGYRAYWGANLINAGTDGTASRRYMGPLPAAGQWVRLEVPAALVGLEGHSLSGLSFLTYNGRATWDRAGKLGGSGQRVNHALSANGASANALSTTPDADFAPSTFPASGAINGNRRGDDWGRGGAWRGSTGFFPNWLEVSFQGQKTISEVDVFTTQDGLDNGAEPTAGMTFALYGLTDFQVQYWDGSAWQAVPGGVVSGNNKVWRQIQFAPVTTSKVRVLCTAGLANAARIVEVEAWGN